jgi:hypothetical protein
VFYFNQLTLFSVFYSFNVILAMARSLVLLVFLVSVPPVARSSIDPSNLSVAPFWRAEGNIPAMLIVADELARRVGT